MAKDINVLKDQAIQICDEVEDGRNTAKRIGGMFCDLVDKVDSTKDEVSRDVLHVVTPRVEKAEEKVNDLAQKVDNSPAIADLDTDSDLDIADEKGNVLARYANGHQETQKFNSRNIGNPDLFDSAKTYAVGDYCTHGNLFYKFIAEHIGEWDIDDVEHITIMEYVKDMASKGEHPIGVAESAEDGFRISDERGNVLAEFKDGHIKTKNFDSRNENIIKILFFGNSYTQDSISYLPFILKNIAPHIKVTIGIAYYSGCTLQRHYANAINSKVGDISPSNYTYYKILQTDTSWRSGIQMSFGRILADETWDIVVLQQGSSSSWVDYDETFKPYAQPLVREIFSQIGHKVKLGLNMNHSSRDTSFDILLSRWESLKDNYKKMMNILPFEFIIPYATAIQNARTCPAIANIYGTSYMQADTNGHLHDGLPCLIAAYSAAATILDILGLHSLSIFRDSLRPSYSWCVSINIPGPHYDKSRSFSVTDTEAYLAQCAATGASKRPYEISDMSEF